jgi:hypothetical protein
MKTEKQAVQKKLKLNRETLTPLQRQEMEDVNGGISLSLSVSVSWSVSWTWSVSF